MRVVILALLLASSSRAQVPSQPNCWAMGEPFTAYAVAAREYTGDWDWFINGTLVTTTTEPKAVLPCDHLTVTLKVQARGGKAFTFKPIYCAAPWDTNQSGTLTSTDTTRQLSIFGKGCSLGRKK